jgi:hypothetical protein
VSATVASSPAQYGIRCSIDASDGSETTDLTASNVERGAWYLTWIPTNFWAPPDRIREDLVRSSASHMVSSKL